MRLVELSVEKFAELKPYVDTLLLPVCAVGSEQAGEPFARDLLWVRQIAAEIERRLTGRVFLLPEAVHTTGQAGESGMPQNVLADYLYHLLLPYKERGLTKLVLLHSADTSGDAIAKAWDQLEQQGFQVLALLAEPDEATADALVQQIIPLWSR
ncbi:DUF2487 family protein [Effusibacillus pohliae]|uniref:DUF2487 family protein n=1 Tax=Effusibacillus pohliae TaxID=232270 RepID=UPI00035E69BA|nr:DUF2487 family protein [Effusibacillus pohliae]